MKIVLALIVAGMLSGCALPLALFGGLAAEVQGGHFSTVVAQGCNAVFWGDGSEPCPTPASYNSLDSGEPIQPSGNHKESY